MQHLVLTDENLADLGFESREPAVNFRDVVTVMLCHFSGPLSVGSERRTIHPPLVGCQPTRPRRNSRPGSHRPSIRIYLYSKNYKRTRHAVYADRRAERARAKWGHRGLLAVRERFPRPNLAASTDKARAANSRSAAGPMDKARLRADLRTLWANADNSPISTIHPQCTHPFTTQ